MSIPGAVDSVRTLVKMNRDGILPVEKDFSDETIFFVFNQTEFYFV